MRKIAILILAHKNETQLFRLIKKLGNEFFDFYIHIDVKADIKLFENELSQLPFNVTIVPQRYNVQLVDFSLVEASMSVVKGALNANKNYIYYAILTGQDYPLKSSKEIFEHLISSYPTSFIDIYGCEDSISKGVKWTKKIGQKYFSQRLRRVIRNLVGNNFYYSPLGKIVKLLVVLYDQLMTVVRYCPKKVLKNMPYIYSAGSHFWILPDISIEYINNIYDSDIKLKEVFRHITAPEESYFQTILSTFTDLVYIDPYPQFSSQDEAMDNKSTLRLIKWYVNGIHTSGHPGIWRKSDWLYIKNSKALFARKFDENIDNEILDILDSEQCN